MNIEDLEYLKQAFEFIRDNTELIDYDRTFETYSNNMMNCENIISRETIERQESTEVSEQSGNKSFPIDFVVWLVGHDKDTIEQMFSDWDKRQ